MNIQIILIIVKFSNLALNNHNYRLKYASNITILQSCIISMLIINYYLINVEDYRITYNYLL